jgi:transposase-like protein
VETCLSRFERPTKSEQFSLFNAIKNTLFPEERSDISNMLEDIRETRFSGGLACLHCGSIAIKKNGKYRSRQRYLCKDCGESFNDMTNTPLSGSRYPHKWLQYFEMMVEGYTLPKIARELEIHISTAFYWRHKILNAIRSLGKRMLKGIIESDETFFLESENGKKGITHREPRKSDGVASKRGISNEQICVLVALDRNGEVISQMAGKGRIKSTDIDRVLGAYIDPSSTKQSMPVKEFTSNNLFITSSTSTLITNASRILWNDFKAWQPSISTTIFIGFAT